MEDSYKKLLEGKSVLITGGTGSFGTSMLKKLLTYDVERIVIFSRDEKKQFDLRNVYPQKNIEFQIGDVRDKERVDSVMGGIDFVFHASALKQVPTGEYFPMELVKTNVLGSHNVIESALSHNVERVVILSTDKACAPINVMGMTKSLMERVALAASRRHGIKTHICATRYGNVLYTRGSVVPHFISLIKEKKPLTITDGSMTRFMMNLDQALDLVLFALTQGENGDLYVRKAPAATIQDLAETISEIFSYTEGIQQIGVRPGEKMHETLVTPEERHRAVDVKDYFKIEPETRDIDSRHYYFEGDTHVIPAEGYHSANTTQLSKDEIREMLFSVPEFKREFEQR